MNQDRIKKLETVYGLFCQKSQELILFFYWTDEFYKGAGQEIANHATQLASAKKRAEAALREFDAEGTRTGASAREMSAAWDRAVDCWRRYGSDLEAMRGQLLCEVALVYMVGLFEAFFADSAAVLLTPKQMERMGGGFLKQVRYLEQTLNLTVDACSVNLRLCDVDEVFARRNLLLHCGGIVDEQYLARVGYSELHAGDEASVDQHYFSRAASGFQSLAQYLCRLLRATAGGVDAASD